MSATSVILLLGSNDTEAQKLLLQAIDNIATTVGEVVKVSKSFRSEAYGFTSEREFINQAVEVITELDAYTLLNRINHIEALLGRDRNEEQRVKAERNEAYASRPIDIDIIFYGDESFEDDRLTIPYHFLDEREYALRPVADIAPERKHPKLAYTPAKMLQNISDKQS
ncbi:MAG: 2-amino-4-hydroxy-6-hydroxymethyldihydropteridine diphosphokinase [Alistipes sp.]|nr:2-amino-4-hydroxy-6-hydroxymethyldihydropteridine diphosphokinase [Alistipes sp.]